jgi:excisionase family DNA binding protein
MTTIPEKDALTVQDAARELGKSEEQVRRYLRARKLRGQRIGKQWFIEKRELEEMKNPGKQKIEALALARKVRWEIKERHGNIDILNLLDGIRE